MRTVDGLHDSET